MTVKHKPTPPLRARATKPSRTQEEAVLNRVLAAIRPVARRLERLARESVATQAVIDQPAVEQLLASRPDLTPEFCEKLRGRSLAQVERTLAHLPPPSAARQEQQIAMGLLRRTSGGVERQGTKLVFGVRRVVRDEASK